jgi:hypothetical protein
MPADPTIPTSRIAWAYAWYRRVRKEPETDTYLAAVEEWRNVWRPPRVKVLLVAESHVRQADRDSGTRLRLPVDLPTQRILPTSYVRLIYCLGYGEPGICVPQPESNSGTDFWEFFKRLALTATQRAITPWSMPSSLNEKVRILERLAERGIWLEDASPLAIYLRQNERIPDSREIVTEGYEHFVWPGVARDAPARVWVVGKRVYQALQGRTGIEDGRWFYQPRGAKRGGLEHEYHDQVERMCRDLDEVAP